MALTDGVHDQKAGKSRFLRKQTKGNDERLIFFLTAGGLTNLEIARRNIVMPITRRRWKRRVVPKD